MSKKSKILILDFGSQYTELITKEIRKLKVYAEVKNFDTKLEDIKTEIDNGEIAGIILSGGPNSVYDEEALDCDEAILNSGLPILGICYGMQMIAHKMGGEVERSQDHEYGKAELEITGKENLFKLCSKNKLISWMSHADQVTKAPTGFETLAKTSNTPITAIANDEKKIYGLQFHPEVKHSEEGNKIIEAFVLEICQAQQSWNMNSFIEEASQKIKEEIGGKKVLLALSGGVDSSTLAFLLKQAIGDQLTCMYIDHGFMRANETEELLEVFQEKFKIKVIHIDAKEKFFAALNGVSDPEEKRKKIGHLFIETFNEEIQKLEPDVEFLAQGTLYSDVIESSGIRINPKTGKRIAASIKSHHNVGGLPEEMPFKLLEPIRTLFKDEVRELAKELSLPDEIRLRHPFPGPGLAIRVLGELSEEKVETVRAADKIVREELLNSDSYHDVWQILTVLLPVRSVGVTGDQRSYAHPIVLRAVTSDDAMTADWARLPYDLLAKISSRIVNEVENVNRVVYDITSKPPGTIEWE